jgi:hypothetical protein
VDGFWLVFWMALVLKIPIVLALWIVWYAIKAEPTPEIGPSDGGGSDRHPPSRPSHPRPPRRGPHAGPAPTSPARVRVRARRLSRTGER